MNFYQTCTDLPTNFRKFTDEKFFTEAFIELGPSPNASAPGRPIAPARAALMLPPGLP